MTGASTPTTRASRTKMRAYRERLRNEGLRPVQFWVPDTRSAKFRAEALRQSTLVAGNDHARDDQAFIDSVSIDWDGE